VSWAGCLCLVFPDSAVGVALGPMGSWLAADWLASVGACCFFLLFLLCSCLLLVGMIWLLWAGVAVDLLMAGAACMPRWLPFWPSFALGGCGGLLASGCLSWLLLGLVGLMAAGLRTLYGWGWALSCGLLAVVWGGALCSGLLHAENCAWPGSWG